MEPLRKILLEKYPEFFEEVDKSMIYFAKEVRRLVREEKDCVIAITAYPGEGKSNLTAILGMLIDHNYNFDENICFIPTSKDITERYMSLKMYSFLHIDEASRGLHKHKWHDKIQQTLNQLYDTERENHFLVTGLLMPRFQNFTENFRNFRIKYWIHIPVRGIAIFYKKDEDKDVKDPWHIEENYKAKMKIWRGQKVFQRDLGMIIRTEQRTPNYWFYCKVPVIPKQVWEMYQKLKHESRTKDKEEEAKTNLPSEELKQQKYRKIEELHAQGYKPSEIAALAGVSFSLASKQNAVLNAKKRLLGSEKSQVFSSKDSKIISNKDTRYKNLKTSEVLQHSDQ